MLTSKNLYDLAHSRFSEAEVLLRNNKPEGAVYLCGYALELMLKRGIMKVLNWDGFPETEKEFKGRSSIKVHKLDILLSFSGLQKKLQNDTELYARWQKASNWDSEIRYRQIGSTSKEEAGEIIEATRSVLNFILKETQ